MLKSSSSLKITPATITLFILLAFGLSACSSSGSSNDESANTADGTTSDGTTTSDDTGTDGSDTDAGETTSEGTDSDDGDNTDSSGDVATDNSIVSGSDIVVLESMGIRTEMPAPDDSMVDHDFIGYRILFTTPSIDIKVTNNSDTVIYNGLCTAVASKDGVDIGDAKVFFADQGFLRPGDTNTTSGSWFELDTFEQMDAVSVSCEWQRPSENTVSPDDPEIAFDLVEWTTGEFGNPLITVQLSNNSSNVIGLATCQYSARIDNEILSSAYMSFNELEDIAPGEAFQETARFGNIIDRVDISTLVLDRDDLYCRWSTR